MRVLLKLLCSFFMGFEVSTMVVHTMRRSFVEGFGHPWPTCALTLVLNAWPTELCHFSLKWVSSL